MFEEGITTVKECVTKRSGQAFVALEYGGQCWNNWGTRHMDGREKLPDSSCANAGKTLDFHIPTCYLVMIFPRI